MNNITDMAIKHSLNLIRMGAYLIISSVISTNLRDSTARTMNEFARDVRSARNHIKEHRAAS